MRILNAKQILKNLAPGRRGKGVSVLYLTLPAFKGPTR
jgi:hypothetical protein